MSSSAPELRRRASVVHPLKLAALLAGFAFLACYFRAFLFPDIALARWGDQVGFFNDGARIVAGELPFRDYLQLVPPGTDLYYAAMIKLFGVRIWIPNLTMAVLAAATAFLMTSIASRILRGVSAALPALGFVGIGLLNSFDATHHWFSTMAILGAVLCLLDANSVRRIAAAGALCGGAGCFTQTKGALAALALAAFLAWGKSAAPPSQQRRRDAALLLGAAAAVFAGFNAYFIWAAGLRPWSYCLVIHPFRYYPVIPINNWRVLLVDYGYHRGMTAWISFPFLYVSIPLTYLATFFVLRKKAADTPAAESAADSKAERERVLLVMVAGLAMLAAIAFSPSIKRLSTVSPAVMILLVWLLDRALRISSRLKLAIAAALTVLIVMMPLSVQLRRHAKVLTLPSGRCAVDSPALYEEYVWLLENTRPGEYSFGMPPFYYTFHLRNPAPMEGIETTDYTRPEHVAALVRGLEEHQVPLLVLRLPEIYQRPTGLASDHLGPFRSYLKNHYRLARIFDTGDEVWLRTGEASGARPEKVE